jgi:general secretion pathway protein J
MNGTNRKLHMRRQPPRNSRGFTLLEILISFVLLALLTTALYGALNLGTRTAEAVNRVTEQTQTTVLAQKFLRDLLQRSHGFSVTGLDGRKSVSFAGGRDWLRFAATMPDISGADAEYLFELGLANEEGHNNLYLQYAQVSSAKSGWQRLLDQRVLLVADVDQLEFEYLDVNGGYGPRWKKEWESDFSLPALVRMNLNEATGGWPEFVVQPKARLLTLADDNDA